MNWKETKKTIWYSYKLSHLKHYSFWMKVYIYIANTVLLLQSIYFGFYGWGKGVFPTNKYQNEKHIFKAWFCEKWEINVDKW